MVSIKILFVSDYYPSRMQPQFCIYIQQQAQALVSLGHQVEVIVPISTYSLKEKIEKTMLAGLTVYYAEYFTLYKKIYSWFALRRNIRRFEKQIDFGQYEVISMQMFDEFTLRIFTSISIKLKKKLIIHYHGLSILYEKALPLPIRILQKRGNSVLKKLVSRADAVVGVSNKVCDRIKDIYRDKPVFTVYNGADTELFRPEETKDNKDYTIITVASLKKIKGNHYVINAFKMLMNKHPNQRFKLIFVGRGPELYPLKTLVASLRLEDNVLFMGFIEYEEVARIMRNCDVFVMPSYYEALGCVYLEAMACRLPVIGCKYQGIDEIIIDGQNGLLVEPHNIRQIYEKLDYLLEYPQKAEEIALKGYQTVLNGFTWRDSAKELQEVYTTILKHKD